MHRHRISHAQSMHSPFIVHAYQCIINVLSTHNACIIYVYVYEYVYVYVILPNDRMLYMTGCAYVLMYTQYLVRLCHALVLGYVCACAECSNNGVYMLGGAERSSHT